MYAINSFQPKLDVCQKCSKPIIEYVGTEAFCTQCQQTISQLQEEVRVVPKMYQSNSGSRVDSSQAKIIKYLNQFANKYGSISDQQQALFLYKEVLLIRNAKGIGTKNYRQNAAAVIYRYLKDLHKLSIKQFCLKNQVNVKPFNRSLLAYEKVLSQKSKRSLVPETIQAYSSMKDQVKEKIEDSDESLQKSSVKIQDSVQVSSENEYSSQADAKFQQFNSGSQTFALRWEERDIQSTLHQNQQKHHKFKSLVNNLYQSFFDSIFYQQNRSAIIDQILQKLTELYQELKVLSQHQNFFSVYRLDPFYLEKEDIALYLLFGVLKRLCHPVSQANYIRKVKEKTGISIKKAVFTTVSRVIASIDCEASVSNTSEDLYFLDNSGTTGSQIVKIEAKD